MYVLCSCKVLYQPKQPRYLPLKDPVVQREVHSQPERWFQVTNIILQGESSESECALPLISSENPKYYDPGQNYKLLSPASERSESDELICAQLRDVWENCLSEEMLGEIFISVSLLRSGCKSSFFIKRRKSQHAVRGLNWIQLFTIAIP